MADETRSAPRDEGGRVDVAPPLGEDASVEAPTAEDPAEVTRQRDEYYDRLLRKTAEFDNYRKRTEKERRELTEYLTADLLHELLPPVDDLERALHVELEGEGG